MEPNQPFNFNPPPPPDPGSQELPPWQPPPAFPGGGGVGWPAPPSLSDLLPTDLYGWGMTITYDIDYGLSWAAPQAPWRQALTQFWRCNSGIATKVVSCVGIAAGGDNPQMPVPKQVKIDVANWDQPNNPDGVPNYPWVPDNNPVLVKAKIVNFAPSNNSDGSQMRGTLAVYLYVYQLAPDITVDMLDLGASPFDSTPAFQKVLNPFDYYHYLSQASQVADFINPTTFNGQPAVDF